MENDLLMCSYIDSIRKTNTANYPYYKEDTTFYIEVNKNYVNKKLASNLIQIDYYYAPGIVVRSNRADYKLLENALKQINKIEHTHASNETIKEITNYIFGLPILQFINY